MNMIEKVAAVIFEKTYENDETCKRIARAIIEAMREPTGKMLYQSIGEESGYEVWTAMIEEALKED